MYYLAQSTGRWCTGDLQAGQRDDLQRRIDRVMDWESRSWRGCRRLERLGVSNRQWDGRMTWRRASEGASGGRGANRDIYSLGAICTRCFTGKPSPTKANTPLLLMERRLDRDPVFAPRKIKPEKRQLAVEEIRTPNAMAADSRAGPGLATRWR